MNRLAFAAHLYPELHLYFNHFSRSISQLTETVRTVEKNTVVDANKLTNVVTSGMNILFNVKLQRSDVKAIKEHLSD